MSSRAPSSPRSKKSASSVSAAPKPAAKRTASLTTSPAVGSKKTSSSPTSSRGNATGGRAGTTTTSSSSRTASAVSGPRTSRTASGITGGNSTGGGGNSAATRRTSNTASNSNLSVSNVTRQQSLGRVGRQDSRVSNGSILSTSVLSSPGASSRTARDRDVPVSTGGRASRRASERQPSSDGGLGSPLQGSLHAQRAESESGGADDGLDVDGLLTADSSIVIAVDPPQERTAEEIQIELLHEEKTRKKLELVEVDNQIKDANMYIKSINMIEKSHSLNEKSDENLEEIKKMKKEIQAMRNSDRVIVNLKDTSLNMEKHVRMRKAHIRQKEATINLIDQRCQEQVASIYHVLQTMMEMSERMGAVTAEKKEAEKYTETVDPLLSAAACLREDAKDEEFIVHCQILCQEMIVKDASVAKKAIALQDTLYDEAHVKGVEKDAEKAHVGQLWTKEKKSLMARYTTATNLKAENDYHVRRGTNLKSFEVLNVKSSSTSVEDLRRLRMYHEENLLQNDLLRQQLAKLKVKAGIRSSSATSTATAGDTVGVQSSRSLDQAALTKLLNQLEGRRGDLVKQNLALQESYNGLHQEYTENSPMPYLTSGAPGSHHTPRRSANAGAATPSFTSPRSYEKVTPGRSTAGDRTPTPKKKFTNDTLARLQKPTQARCSHLDAHEEEEIQRRDLINRVRMNRPVGLKRY